MILHKIGVGASYHELQDWGMDILKVGNSLGSGAIGLLLRDTLHRVTAPEGASFHQLVSGPLRSVFDLDFAAVKCAERTLRVKHRISIVAGVYGYESQVFLEGETDGIQVVPGIVNMQSDTAYEANYNGMALLYTYDRQSFDEEYLGMALMSFDAHQPSWSQTPDSGEGIVQTYVHEVRAGCQRTGSVFLPGWLGII